MEMSNLNDCIENLELQIRWIEEIDAHKFPGWKMTVRTMQQAVGVLKAQEPRLITENDFENADECGYIPVWCEASDGIFAECITVGALKESDCKYWTSKPTSEQMKAVKWE